MTERGTLKILHVVRQFHPGLGGIEEFVAQLARHQALAGHDVRVITLNRIFADPHDVILPTREGRDGYLIERIPFRGSMRYPVAPSILGSIGDADIIHVHAVDFFADYLAATVAIHRKPMVLTTHGGFFHTEFAQSLKRLYFASITRASLSQYGAVIACSTEDERLFRPIAGNRLLLIANPVDIDKFAGKADPTSPVFIYFGRIAPNKRVDLLLAWFAGLAAIQPHARLIIAGKPMGTDIDELRKQAELLNINERVEFHLSPDTEALGALVARSSVYVCASSYEGFGLAAVEAASAGLFLALSDIPPFAASIERLGFGELIDFDDVAGWPASYDRLASSRSAFQRRFGREATRRAVEPFDWAASAPHFEEVYRRVIGTDRRRIGRLSIDVCSRDEVKRRISASAAAGKPLMVAFANAHSVNLASHNRAFVAAMDGALLLNDGLGVDIASKALFGAPFPSNLNGTDLVPDLFASTTHPLRLYLLGGVPGVAERAADTLVKRFANVTVVGLDHGYFERDEEERQLGRIAASGANMVLVAMGQPQQEEWAQRHWRDLPGPCLCVGALLDFLAGEVPRAPVGFRRLRLEWAYRLAQEPRRLARRYLVGNIAFLWRLAGQRLVGPRL